MKAHLKETEGLGLSSFAIIYGLNLHNYRTKIFTYQEFRGKGHVYGVNRAAHHSAKCITPLWFRQILGIPKYFPNGRTPSPKTPPSRPQVGTS